MTDPDSGSKESVTEVAEESFVRERPSEIERGTVLAGRYQIEDIIGKGGSGIVLRVFDRTAQNVVALKVLKSELARDGKWEKRFSRELRLGRPLQHPNVCRIFDIGEADGHRFLTMELASGGSLRDELKRTRSIERPIAERLADAKAVIDGLAALHKAGVVHRDFKPDNILRMGDGRLVLSDFGLATDAANAPGATVLIGTPHYMAPEVLAGEPATSRSDVWALGVVLHEIVFGQRPERRSVSFDGSSRGPLRPKSAVERSMLALCERCLADAPLDRPSDAGAVSRMLETARLSRPGQSKRRLDWPLRYVALTVVLGSIAGLVTRHGRRTTKEIAATEQSAVVHLTADGAVADWSKTARTVAEMIGEVHCFSMLNDRTARLVWGAPRQAEDIDIGSGRRRVSDLVPETYRIGCPELSPNGHSLLYTGRSDTGAVDVRLSEFEDGHDAKTVTSGSDPQWLGRNEEFSYDVDSSHAAIFSLPTATLTLLPEPEFGTHRMILQKAVSSVGNAVALLVGNDRSEYAVAVYEGPGFGRPKVFGIPTKSRIQFGTDNETVIVSYRLMGATSVLAALDWRANKMANVGLYRGFDLPWAHFPEEPVLLARRVVSDAWLYEGTQRRRLTSDGRNYSVARSSKGDLLLSKLGDDGAVNIWWQGLDGASRELTHGGRDVEPTFSTDGRSWSYADYAQKSIMVCSRSDDACRVLQKDEMLPSWPRFSPGGQTLAYLTTVGVSKLIVVSISDGHVVASWSAYYQCPPVWSSATTLWSLEVSGGKYFWSERDVTTGMRTGNRQDGPHPNVALDEVQCWPKSASSESPFFQKVRVESQEMSRLLRLGGEQ